MLTMCLEWHNTARFLCSRCATSRIIQDGSLLLYSTRVNDFYIVPVSFMFSYASTFIMQKSKKQCCNFCVKIEGTFTRKAALICEYLYAFFVLRASLSFKCTCRNRQNHRIRTGALKVIIWLLKCRECARCINGNYFHRTIREIVKQQDYLLSFQGLLRLADVYTFPEDRQVCQNC